jgi:Na+/H+ antiporter NhaD/arsenite permease-like protein
MIVVANLRLSGLFALANAWAIRKTHRPITLLGAVIRKAGVCSAFLVNDALHLVLGPIVFALTPFPISARRRRSPAIRKT